MGYKERRKQLVFQKINLCQFSQTRNSHGIALDAKTRHDRFGDWRDKGVVAKRFTRMHIADMQLNQDNASAFDRVMQSDTGVGISARIENNPSELSSGLRFACFMNPIDQLPFVVRLAKIQSKTMAFASTLAQGFDIIQALGAVDQRFSRSQEVEVGPVQYHYSFHTNSKNLRSAFG